MKKKILTCSLGIVICAAAVFGAAENIIKREEVTVITEEKKNPVRNAADTIEAGALSEEVSLTENIDDTEGIEKITEYLSCYFDIVPETDGFFTSLTKICPTYIEEQVTIPGETEKTSEEETFEEKTEKTSEEKMEERSAGEMIKASVAAAGKEALAQTYSDKKVQERFEFYGIHETKRKTSDTDKEFNKYIVCAMDLGMIDEEIAQSAVNGELTEEEQAELLMSVANICGKGRNYIGYSNDENIYAALNFAYGLYSSFTEGELCETAAKLLDYEAVQECVLKKSAYAAKFLPALTVCYSHDSLEHLEQLIGLLSSENIVAKVQLEPKMVLTRKDIEEAAKRKTEEDAENSEETRWENVGTLKYDLVLEFETQEDMLRFCDLVEKYAKTQEKEDQEESELTKEWILADSEEAAIYMAEGNVLLNESTREIEKVITENSSGKVEVWCLLDNAEVIKENILKQTKEQEMSVEETESVNEESNSEDEETETEVSMKIYSKRYTCSKDVFYGLGGTDEEEIEEESEETAAKQTAYSDSREKRNDESVTFFS